jgi:peptide deformylase
MIVLIPNPVLTTPAKPVVKIDKKILDIIARMKKTLIEADKPKGVGLAAPQIGVPYRIFIVRPKENSPITVFINPEIIERSKDLSEIKREGNKLEGCLSVPNIWGHLKRPARVKLRFTDVNGKREEKEFSGFVATIIQHETDHLDGILFTKRVLEQKEKLYEGKEDDKGNEKLVEIKI